MYRSMLLLLTVVAFSAHAWADRKTAFMPLLRMLNEPVHTDDPFRKCVETNPWNQPYPYLFYSRDWLRLDHLSVTFLYPNSDENSLYSPVLQQDCLPDTLYSWGNFSKADRVFQYAKEGSSWNRNAENPILFTSPFPFATIHYGSIPIRIKLKRDFKLVRVYDPLRHVCPKTEDPNSVYLRFVRNENKFANQSFMEYYLCSLAPVESISYGFPEHYREVLRDLAFNLQETRYAYNTLQFSQASPDLPVSAVRISPNRFRPVGSLDFIRGDHRGNQDGHEMNQEVALEHLKDFYNFVIDNVEDRQFVSNPNRVTTVVDHFKTEKKSWFILNVQDPMRVLPRLR